MKLFVLRHELRYSDPTFYTNLTKKGLENTKILKNVLDKVDINLIFSSPFLRVLQTIAPYCDMKKSKVNVDYSLYETMYDVRFTKNNYQIQLLPKDNEYYLINPDYKSLISVSDIKCPERHSNVQFRTNNFMKFIMDNYKNTDYNILIASHMSAINTIIKKRDNHIYPMGGLAKIYEDNKECYIPINF